MSYVCVHSNLLDLSKLSAGKMDVESAPFSPSSLVNETVQLFQASAHLKGLQMKSIVLEESLPNVVLGDRCKIQQILMNLLNNGTNVGGNPILLHRLLNVAVLFVYSREVHRRRRNLCGAKC